MNRPIKFRAWNEKDSNPNARMIHPATLTHDGRVVMPDGEEWDIPVMQFTGLLDKNGKEIYEGDIVTDTPENFKSYGDKISEIYEVKYEPDFVGWLPFVYHGGNEPIVEECEVIGNIYENPDLLT